MGWCTVLLCVFYFCYSLKEKDYIADKSSLNIHELLSSRLKQVVVGISIKFKTMQSVLSKT